MTIILTIIATAMFLTASGTVYYSFFRQPNKLKKLNADINSLASDKDKLSQTVDTLTKNNNSLEQTYSKLKSETDKLNSEWNKLSNSISNGQDEIKQIGKDKAKIQSDILQLKSEIEKLKTAFTDSNKKLSETIKELSVLTGKKETLQASVNTIETAVNKLKGETSNLQQRKFDLEEENSHLSREIVKKKISYRAVGEPEVIVKKYDDEQGHTGAVKHIGYKPNNLFSKDCFPFVSMPQDNSVIKFPRKGRLGQRGITEPFFEEHLKTYFLRQRNMQFYIDRFLFVSNNTRPYEPDFVLIDEKENLNLFIDIEIDEPYDGIGRYAMHFKGQDNFRNQYFNDRGWIVIRFSEKQAHLNPKECCRFISEVIKSVNSKFTIPQDLQNILPVKEEPFWTKLKSEQWARDNYRENYLSTIFTANPKVIIDTDNLIQNETEKEVEKRVPKGKDEPEKIKGKINEINLHHRDSRLIFYPEPHIYLIDGNPRTISASTLVKRFFPDYDTLAAAQYVANRDNISIEQALRNFEDNRNNAASLGTELHTDIENYFDSGIIPDKPEFEHFLNFYNAHLSSLMPYRTEWRIFDDVIYVAGTADMIFRKSDGTYAIYDWKRSKKIEQVSPENRFAKFGFGSCSSFTDCNYNHYSLQLNIYKKILEDYYSKTVSEMYFVQLHPNFDSYNLYEVQNMQDTVDKMFNALTD